MQNYRWATLGCGVIANELAQALASRGQTLYSVANRTHAKAEAFAEKYGIEKVYDQIDDVFADPDVDIIYISTPHNTHIQYLRKALAAGKHVLCEKSITLNSDELDEAIRLAEKEGYVPYERGMALKSGDKVTIAGFGRFEMRERQTKNFTNPKTKVTSKLEPTAIPGFKASGRLKEKVSG